MLRVLTLATLFPNGVRPAFGGFVERQTRELAALPDVEVEVVAPVGLPVWPLSLHPHYSWLRALPARETRNGLVVHRPRYRIWPALLKARRPEAMAAALLPLLRDIRSRFPFDVIDAEFFWPDGPAARRLADAFEIPFSVKARGSDIHLWGKRPDIAAQILAAGEAAGGLLAVSAALRRDMIALGLPEEKIRVHHTGVDLDRFRPDAGAAPGVEKPVLITVANLIPRKGQEFALAALALLPEATLILVGAGPDRGRLEELARTLGLASRVRFLGARPHEALPGLLAAANVMVLPTASEGLANVWVESLACGTPVVTSDVGGAREVIDRPEAGRLAARDPEAIAAAVRELLAAPPDRAAVRAAAARFSWARNAAELRDHLAGLAG
ncbi:MAG TPA: glycosyltransferase [Allosphingosinicella sp.]|nr:glycosyltransferase [Allosphingosinicella sp.]